MLLLPQSVSSISVETEMVLSIFLWMWIHPSFQAVINDVTNAVCPYNCHQHGECHVSRTKDVVSCSCHVGWGGNTCDIPCHRHCVHGQCVFAGDKQLCLCTVGYRGERCTEPGYDLDSLLTLAKLLSANTAHFLPIVQDPGVEIRNNIQRGSSTCTSNFVCQHGGRCINGEAGGYRCDCDTSQYTGSFCQYTCPRSCLNGGTCIRLRNSGSRGDTSDLLSLPESQAVYRCACPEGFTGERCSSRTGAVFSINTSLGT